MNVEKSSTLGALIGIHQRACELYDEKKRLDLVEARRRGRRSRPSMVYARRSHEDETLDALIADLGGADR